MHGLICKSFEGFMRTAYGGALWTSCVNAVDGDIDAFETMFHYDAKMMGDLVSTCAGMLGKDRETLLEDFGTHLVAGSETGRVRRLLRFGGVDYEDLLHSLEDLPGRAALAMPDLGLPTLELFEQGVGEFVLEVTSGFDGAAYVVMGLLRALADDYGALVLLDHLGAEGGRERLGIQLLMADFSEGKGFDLSEVRRAIGGTGT